MWKREPQESPQRKVLVSRSRMAVHEPRDIQTFNPFGD
jgi:hypothetical protein